MMSSQERALYELIDVNINERNYFYIHVRHIIFIKIN